MTTTASPPHRPRHPRRRPPAIPQALLDLTPDAIQHLGLGQLEHLVPAAQAAHGSTRAWRASIVSREHPSRSALAEANAQLALLGGLVASLCARRNQLRREARRAAGSPVPGRAEAIAAAAEAVLDRRSWRKVQAAARQIRLKAQRDGGGTGGKA